MTKAQDSNAALAGTVRKAHAKHQAVEAVGQVVGQAIGQAARTLLPTSGKSGSGTGLLGLSAALVVGMGIGAAIGSDQPAASGADVRLPLDDEPKGGKDSGHQADYDCAL